LLDLYVRMGSDKKDKVSRLLFSFLFLLYVKLYLNIRK
jgi:hypothetical protein